MGHPVTAGDLLALQDGALDAVLARNRRSQWAPAKQGGPPPKAKGQKGGGKGAGGRGGGGKRKAAQGGKPAVKSLKVGAGHLSCRSSPMFPPAQEYLAGSSVKGQAAMGRLLLSCCRRSSLKQQPSAGALSAFCSLTLMLMLAQGLGS